MIGRDVGDAFDEITDAMEISDPQVRVGADPMAAIAILGVAPAVGATGLFGVSWDYGHWVCLAAFLGATWASYEEHRRRLRAAARRE